MKKTIYELNKKEGKALLKEFKKTSYYKQYFIEYLTSTLIFALFCGFLLGWYSTCDCKNSEIIEMISAIGFVITIGFIFVIAISTNTSKFNYICIFKSTLKVNTILFNYFLL